MIFLSENCLLVNPAVIFNTLTYTLTCWCINWPMISASSKQQSGIAAFLLAALKCFCRIKECSHSVQTSDFADFDKLLEMYTGSNSGTFSLEFLPYKQICSMEVKNLYLPSEQGSLSTISVGTCHKTQQSVSVCGHYLAPGLLLKGAIMQQ